MDMTCPNCQTRVPVLLENQDATRVINTTRELHEAVCELTDGSRVIRLVTPSEAARAPKRPLTTIAGELRQALEEEKRAEELSLAADKAQRTAAHYKVDAMRRVHQLRHELTMTAEGRR